MSVIILLTSMFCHAWPSAFEGQFRFTLLLASWLGNQIVPTKVTKVGGIQNS